MCDLHDLFSDRGDGDMAAVFLRGALHGARVVSSEVQALSHAVMEFALRHAFQQHHRFVVIAIQIVAVVAIGDLVAAEQLLGAFVDVAHNL